MGPVEKWLLPMQAQAFFTLRHESKAKLRPMLWLVVGLVLFTATGGAWFVHQLVPTIPWAATFALGPIVSPPDAVAVARGLHLPKRLVTVLEGGSLANEATGLVVLRFELTALAAGSFSLPAAAAERVKVGAGGVAVGVVTGWAMFRLRRRLDEDAWPVTLSLLTPFEAYLPAARHFCSGSACGALLASQNAERCDVIGSIAAWPPV